MEAGAQVQLDAHAISGALVLFGPLGIGQQTILDLPHQWDVLNLTIKLSLVLYSAIGGEECVLLMAY